MFSWPPATTTSMPSTMICLAAVAMAMRPEAHWRSMVWPGTVTGKPAARAALRAKFMPAVPLLSTVPMTTSSTSAPSKWARSTACAITWPSKLGDLV